MIALAYVTCDKYSHVWEQWYEAFTKHWGVELPCYFCGEELKAPFFKPIPHESVPVEMWTAKLREQVEQIPEEYIFVWVDDHIQQFSIDMEFMLLTEWIKENSPDALRIMGRSSRSRYKVIDMVRDRPLFELIPNTHYRVSFSPNIYKKDFLLEALRVDESPWSAELRRRYFPRKKICSYHIDGWYVNKIDHNV